MLEEIERMGMVQEEGRGEKQICEHNTSLLNFVESSIVCGHKGP